MDITLNGDARSVADGHTVADLVRDLELGNKRIAVEVNRRIIRAEQYAETALAAGDQVEIVHFVGGG